jgi:prepilin-type N-terminal cleavage/methylation domain-containing protein
VSGVPRFRLVVCAHFVTVPSRRRTAAFSLIEVLVALALLTVALLSGAAIGLQRPAAMQRIEAQAKALRAMEGTLEALRTGALPLASGPAPAPAGLAVDVEVESAGLSGLWSVRIEVRYAVRDQARRRELRSLVWRPL